MASLPGAACATASSPAVSTLVKVQTGIGSVDAAAYLRQAAEIESREAGASAAHSHPETFIRARALALWWEGAADLDPWLETRLHGPLALEKLDLPGQVRLQALTRGFLAHFLAGTALASETVLAQVRMMFPDWRDDEPAIGPEGLGPDVADDSVRGYLNALMMDLALATRTSRTRRCCAPARWRRRSAAWTRCKATCAATPASASASWTASSANSNANWPGRAGHE